MKRMLIIAAIIVAFFINQVLPFTIGGNPLPSGGGRSLVNSCKK